MSRSHGGRPPRSSSWRRTCSTTARRWARCQRARSPRVCDRDCSSRFIAIRCRAPTTEPPLWWRFLHTPSRCLQHTRGSIGPRLRWSPVEATGCRSSRVAALLASARFSLSARWLITNASRRRLARWRSCDATEATTSSCWSEASGPDKPMRSSVTHAGVRSAIMSSSWARLTSVALQNCWRRLTPVLPYQRANPLASLSLRPCVRGCRSWQPTSHGSGKLRVMPPYARFPPPRTWPRRSACLTMRPSGGVAPRQDAVSRGATRGQRTQPASPAWRLVSWRCLGRSHSLVARGVQPRGSALPFFFFSGVDRSQMHDDATSFALHGEYPLPDGRDRGGQPTTAAKRGITRSFAAT